ncbi:MAG TPA: hypothetical protein VFL57_04810 [Bryobacteraceae bacterium]|nr:hypothetical protein [Bryobacteraceae bacterium]
MAELARCIAEAQGALTEAQLLALFEFLFKPCAHRREWEPFRAAYVAALCESAPVQPSVVVEMGARPQGGTLTAVGIMTLAWSAAPRLELLDLFCQII